MIRLPAGPAFVRSLQKKDAAEITLHANDRRVWINLRDAFPHPYRLADAEAFIEGALAQSPPRRFAIEVDGHPAGGIGYTPHTDVERIGAEIGYWLGTPFWGRGVATAAVRALSAHLFASQAELRRLYAVPFTWNPASARVLEKAGYRLEGTLRQSAIKDGKVVDQWMYALVRDDVAASNPW